MPKYRVGLEGLQEDPAQVERNRIEKQRPLTKPLLRQLFAVAKKKGKLEEARQASAQQQQDPNIPELKSLIVEWEALPNA